MRWYIYGLRRLAFFIILLAVVGCQQENPAEKTGKEIIEHTQGAIDKAKEVGKIVEDAAEKTAEQVNGATE